MRKLASLKGAKALTKKEQKSIDGGASKSPPCNNDFDCIKWGHYRSGRCKCDVSSGACYAPSNPNLCRK